MKAQIQESIKRLQEKKESWLGQDGKIGSDNFKCGLIWGISSLEDLLERAEKLDGLIRHKKSFIEDLEEQIDILQKQEVHQDKKIDKLTIENKELTTGLIKLIKLFK